MTRPRRWMRLVVVAGCAGCAHASVASETLSISDSDEGPSCEPPAWPSRGESCAIETFTVLEPDRAPGKRFGEGGEYEVIGSIQIRAKQARTTHSGDLVGKSSTGPGSIRFGREFALVRARACRMGGEAISLLAEDDVYTASYFERRIEYFVWAKRT